MLTFQSTVTGRLHSASFFSLLFYPSLFSYSLLPPYTFFSTLLSLILFSVCIILCSLQFSPSYDLMSWTSVISSSPNSLLLCTSPCTPIQRLVLFLTQYGTVPPDILRTSSFQPYRFITKPTSQKKKKIESVGKFCKRFHVFCWNFPQKTSTCVYQTCSPVIIPRIA